MNKFYKILNKIFKSWIFILILIGVVGTVVTFTITIHDSLVMHSKLERISQFLKETPSKTKVNSLPTWDETELVVSNGGNSQRDISLDDGFVELHLIPIDPHGNTGFELSKVESFLEKNSNRVLINKIEGLGMRVFESRHGAYSVETSSVTWGDIEFSNINYLLNCSLWFIIPLIFIVISFLLRKWLIWLVKD